ncbi:RHS repeat-associated core domain-containing protein [Spongiactinospora sp. TRM90649]|uniref:RHS repeat-associated core domain-containing protein n=1 Tax=Spongiactinospora sp. TRM90649 TaxID=3031114 RepID=UPI0023F843B6|nr:RHS repeat-associated core domain-containing protein [Spongiactinospora sp. TRM90649]MDF5751842.1 RHS repeat-associated core domain-containing protein [Spongiactinospora sp. TRM90649]
MTGDVAVAAKPTPVQASPVTVAAVDAKGPAKVRVQSYGADVAKRLGGIGVAVRTARADGATSTTNTGTGTGKVRLGLSYAGFRDALPSGAASRLSLLQFPACALAAQPAATCARSARTVPIRNDRASGRIEATVDVGDSVYVLAVAAAAADPGSGITNFAATDLKAAGTWQAGSSGGGFNYSYPITVPPSVNGPGPQLALSYSSSAIDGLTNYTNNQASVAGMGWDLGVGFIEQRFRPCADDSFESRKGSQRDWKDLCWESPDENDGDAATTDYTTSNLVLSLEGKSSSIVKDKATGTYKTADDYGWKIERLTSDVTQQPYWLVTTTDGTAYRFGYRRDSMWQTAYFGDDNGEPCRDKYPSERCFAPWRWNMDQEVDTNANLVDYRYFREENWYCMVPGALCNPGGPWDPNEARVPYDRGGYLQQVEYGHNKLIAGSTPTARVTFNAVDRGTPPRSGAPWDNDTPTDLDCAPRSPDVVTACDDKGPTFFTSKRLNTIVTSTAGAAGAWDEVTRLELGYKWVYTEIIEPLPPSAPVLWLDTIRPVGLAGNGPDIPLPPVDFEATLLDNRADYNSGQGKSRLRFPRISAIYNGLGGRTDISYGQANPCPVPSGYPTTGWDNNARDCYQATLGSYYDDAGMSHTAYAVYMKWLATQVTDKDLVGGSPDVTTRYQYVGTPAWARPFNYNDVETTDGIFCGQPSNQYCKQLNEDWDDFRGYGTVRTIVGDGPAADDYSVTSATYFRGMYDDPRSDGTPKHTTVTDFDGNTHNDLRVLSGRILQEQTLRATTVTSGALAALAAGCTYARWSLGFYVKGDRVTWKNHHWEAVGPTVNEPGTNSAWKDLGDCASGGGGGATPTPTSPGPGSGVGPGGYEEVSSTRHEYVRTSTGTGPGIYDPLMINTSATYNRERVTAGWRRTEQRFTYDSYGLPSKLNDLGDTATAADNVCRLTTYARNTGKWMLSLPAGEERRAGDDCAAGEVLGRTTILYDGATDPAANTPTRGNPTQSRVHSSTSEYSTTKATFDGYGRPISATDAVGKVTTTAYAPATGWPSNGITVTNPLGHAVTTWPSASHGQASGIRDADGDDTQVDYDAAGRTVQLWTPLQPRTGGTPAAKIGYTVSFDGTLGQPTAPARTTLSNLRSGSGGGAVWGTTHTYIDGWGRPRERQADSPAGGRMVNVTTYDGRGQRTVVSEPAHNTAAPGSGLLNPALTDLPQWTRTVYDGLARPTATIDYTGSRELRRTTTRHYGDRYEMQPPTGAKTVYHTDIADQVVKIEEWADTATHHDTAYAYDRNGWLTSMTDAKGNVRTFTYDLRGLRTLIHDPDAGDTRQQYDAAGRVTWSRDGNGTKVSYRYDDIGRRTGQWAGEPDSGVKLAEWTYDTLSKGALTSATRFTDGRAYTNRVLGYDALGRPTGSTLVIPAEEGALAGQYTFTAAYNAAGDIERMGMPAAGGLPAETVTSSYTELGLAKGLTSDFGGGFTYVKDTSYTATGRLSERAYGERGQVKRGLVWDEGTGRLNRVTTTAQADTTTPRTAQDDRFTYDVSGEVTRILDAASAIPGSTEGQSECFTYDGRHQLSAAYTTTASSCAGTPDGRGVDPYDQRFTYDTVGNITTKTDAGRTSTYRYAAAGANAVRPNAVGSIERPGGTDTFRYDNAGQLISRDQDGKSGAFEWNELGELTKATIDGQDTSMVYDANGERLIRRTPDGKTTLYLGSMEVELSGGLVTAKRYYSTPDESVVAMRATGRGLTWLATGQHGSQQVAVDDATGTVSRERYLPFGQRRGADDLPFTDRGFLGKIEDASTGLDYLSARYYDPVVGRFVSTDPLLDMATPTWANPYSYAGNNPIGLSDPTGLNPCSPQDSDYKTCMQDQCARKFGKVKCAENRLREAERRRDAEWKAFLDALLELGKLAADELGITDGIKCFTTGDLGACSQTALNILGSLAGGIAGKLVAKYGLPWKWKKLANVVAKAKNLIEKAYNAYKAWGKSKDEVKAAQNAVNAAKRACKSSFVPGTPVLMADGRYKPIEEVKVGDQVAATDPKTGKTKAQPILAVISSEGVKRLVRITVDTDGARGDDTGVIIATDEHPFWRPDRRAWAAADELRPNDRLRTAIGTTVKVSAVTIRPAYQRVHNLTVASVQTYHVGAGSAAVLVHNTACWHLEYAEDIARGHAGNKHAKDFPGMSLDDLTEHVKNVMRNPVKTKELRGGRMAYLGEDGTIVIFDPSNPDGGTVFKRAKDTLDEYWEGLS